MFSNAMIVLYKNQFDALLNPHDYYRFSLVNKILYKELVSRMRSYALAPVDTYDFFFRKDLSVNRHDPLDERVCLVATYLTGRHFRRLIEARSASSPTLHFCLALKTYHLFHVMRKCTRLLEIGNVGEEFQEWDGQNKRDFSVRDCMGADFVFHYTRIARAGLYVDQLDRIVRKYFASVARSEENVELNYLFTENNDMKKVFLCLHHLNKERLNDITAMQLKLEDVYRGSEEDSLLGRGVEEKEESMGNPQVREWVQYEYSTLDYKFMMIKQELDRGNEEYLRILLQYGDVSVDQIQKIFFEIARREDGRGLLTLLESGRVTSDTIENMISFPYRSSAHAIEIIQRWRGSSCKCSCTLM